MPPFTRQVKVEGRHGELGRFSARFALPAHVSPEAHLSAEVQVRPDPRIAGRTIAHAAVPASSDTIDVGALDERDGLVVVLTVRSVADATAPVIAYGLSRRFDVPERGVEDVDPFLALDR